MAPEMGMMPTTTGKVEATGRLPSIELEPKTLTLDQIKYAREQALYVVSTKSEEEAMRIFTAGLKPVQPASAAQLKSNSFDSSDDDVDLGGSGGFYDNGGYHTGGGRCGGGSKGGRRGSRRTSSIADDIRDVLTAPSSQFLFQRAPSGTSSTVA